MGPGPTINGLKGLGVHNFKRDVTKVELDQLVAELAAAASSAASSTASATLVKRDTAPCTPLATITSSSACDSASASASSSTVVIDPNDPVQKSIWSILGKVASGILGIFGGNSNSHKIKRDLDALVSAASTTTTDTGSSSNSESSVFVDLNDPVQKAVWSKIGSTVLGSITKRDVDNLTDEQLGC
ncbi:unnamed protein product [Ambrosiozyma monospora]|uniref:Unnamed protein product n=1 Tax=Ambrosiozyma monospora TaxID=43982 RepID=A0A9W6TAU6_AMBMO|nr:unnamed protein product [Ambrosiozyma monospora]